MASQVMSRGESTLDRTSSPTVWLFQIISDVWIGQDETGADLFLPAPIDLFYSNDTGGRNATYRWEEWETTKKELRVRGYDYRGHVYSKATSEGRELEKHCQDYLDYVVAAVRDYNPNNLKSGSTTTEVQYIPLPYIPAWIYITLVVTMMVMAFVVLQFANR